jgi:hypothetical protein
MDVALLVALKTEQREEVIEETAARKLNFCQGYTIPLKGL